MTNSKAALEYFSLYYYTTYIILLFLVAQVSKLI